LENFVLWDSLVNASPTTKAMGRRICFTKYKALGHEVLKEAYESSFAKCTKIKKNTIGGPNMKRDITKFILNCGICQQVKIEH
jgi:hypothetical protein